MAWFPTLPHAKRQHALELARGICDWLREHPSPDAFQAATEALVFRYMQLALPDERLRQAEGDSFLRVAEALRAVPSGPTLYDGFLGVGWIVDHVRSLDGPTDSNEDGLEEIDDALLELVTRVPWTGHHDLISGLSGCALYALARLPRPSARESLASIVARLEEAATWHDELASWFTRSELLPPSRVGLSPDGLYEIGVAHGVGGLLLPLGCAERANVLPEVARRLRRGAQAWLLSKWRHGSHPFGRFSGEFDGNDEGRAVGWCYGDPGIAATLLATGEVTGDVTLRQQGKTLATVAATRPEVTSAVADSGLCHGAGGLMHLYNRAHHATGEAVFGVATERWFDRVVELERPPRESSALSVESDPTLLGAAGLALALLAIATPFEPRWDVLLLASPPLLR